MADRQTPGFPESFGEMITQWERSFDAFANQLMGTEEFSRNMNQAQSAQLGFQKGFTEMMARQLATMNMPTRDDVLRVAEMVNSLDQRMARIEKLLAPAKPAGTGMRKGPPRSKQPPSKIAAGTSSTKEGSA